MTNQSSIATSSPPSSAVQLNLDYLSPTISAIAVGIIHHICYKNEELSLVSILIIISPSMPVICQTLIKIITWILNLIINLTCGNMFSPIGSMLSSLGHIFKPTSKHGLKEDGITPIFNQYATDKTPSEKMVEWQALKYYIVITTHNNTMHNVIKQITNLTSFKYDVFYYSGQIHGEHIEIYKYNDKMYIATTSEKYTYAQHIYNDLFPSEHKYQISRIYNKYSKEIMRTIKKYKTCKTHAININFLFSGKPGTCKTYAARAIAAELDRTIKEVDLKLIIYEDQFLELFKESEIKTTVYLLDEIDLMCPTREYDDTMLKQLDINRRQHFGSGPSSISTFASISDTKSNNDEQQSDEMHKIHEKLDKLLNFQDWLKLILQLILKIVYLVYMKITNLTFKSDNLLRCKYDVFIQNIDQDCDVTHVKPLSNILNYISNTPSLYENDTACNKKVCSSNKLPSTRSPFTLRTLLNFISGGTTPDGLCIVATTNRPELLDPALTRAGRLRHMQFNYLSIQDAINLIRDMFEVDGYAEDDIRQKLQEINYKDYQSSGALLSAVILSSVTLDQCIEVFDRELKELDS